MCIHFRNCELNIKLARVPCNVTKLMLLSVNLKNQLAVIVIGSAVPYGRP